MSVSLFSTRLRAFFRLLSSLTFFLLPSLIFLSIPGAGGGLGHLAVQYAKAMGESS